MRIVPQYQDLTEVVGCWPGRDYDYVNGETVTFTPGKIKTEFAFAVTAPGQSGKPIEEHGFKHVSSMTNWYSSHRGQDRELKFYWLKLPKGKNIKGEVKRVTWGEKNDSCGLASGGCGFALGEPPLDAAHHFKFFTLLRMAVEPGKMHLKWLDNHNYRLIGKGTLASFWVNGWDPDKFTVALEKKYFKEHDKDV